MMLSSCLGDQTNQLLYGDNLTLMREMPNQCVDLIYLDPPFNSNRRYNLLYKNATGLPVPEQVEAFCDTWEMDPEKEEMAQNMPLILHNYGVDEALIAFWQAWIEALRRTQSKLLAYLIDMAYRLLELRRLLRPTGSIYLHCDPTASHYIKIMMDGLFGYQNFKNEIVWHYTGGGRSKTYFSRKHDIIFWYSKTNKGWTFNIDAIRVPYKQTSGYAKGGIVSAAGKQYRPHPQGTPVDSVWDIPIINPLSKERLGYPTQKPIALLDRIIKASSNEGDVVFDPFCGCGTTIYAAHHNNRKWIGCDIAILSVQMVRDVLAKSHGLRDGIHYEIKGIPLSLEGAQDLFNRDPHQFQHWAVELAGGFCSQKRSGDKGIDGRIYFEMDKKLPSMVISVKGGHTKPADVRELHGVLARDTNSILAGFICLEKPTKGMIQESASAGIFEYRGKSYDRIQIRSITDLLAGRGFHTPSQVQTMDRSRQTELPV